MSHQTFGDFVDGVRYGELTDELNEKLSELVNACVDTGKVGTLTLQIKEVEKHPFLVVPDNHSIDSLEDFLPKPLRKKVSLRMRDEKSFVAYFNLHKADASQIYGQVDPPKLVGILDDNGANENGWREHTVAYDCPLSRQWKAWLDKNGKPQTQEEFANFIERNLLDIIEPSCAEMLEISRSFEAKKKVDFKSAVRLDNGQVQFGYEEEIQGTAAKGSIQIPETFKIGVPVFENGTGYMMSAVYAIALWKLSYACGTRSLILKKP